MLYILAGGELYRGFGRLWPSLLWDTQRHEWKIVEDRTPREGQWGHFITPARAEELFGGCTATPPPAGVQVSASLAVSDLIRLRPELFDDYDFPSVERTVEEQRMREAYFHSVLPAHLEHEVVDRDVAVRFPGSSA